MKAKERAVSMPRFTALHVEFKVLRKMTILLRAFIIFSVLDARFKQ